jgi:hypothetical protein
MYFGECARSGCSYEHGPARNVSAGKRRDCVKRMTKAALGFLVNNPVGRRAGDGGIIRQKVATPIFTKFSIVNPMSQPTTTADIPLNPAPELTTVSQKTVPVRHRVRAPEECTRALPPAITQAGARQKLDTAMSARARTQPAGAGVGRITTQIWPGAKVTNLTAGTGCLQLHRVQAGAQPAQEPAQEPAGLTKHMQHYVTRIVTREGTRKYNFRSYLLQTQ